MSISGQASIVTLKCQCMYMTYYVIIEGLLHISRDDVFSFVFLKALPVNMELVAIL